MVPFIQTVQNWQIHIHKVDWWLPGVNSRGSGYGKWLCIGLFSRWWKCPKSSVIVFAQLSEYAKHHWIVHLKWENPNKEIMLLKKERICMCFLDPWSNDFQYDVQSGFLKSCGYWIVALFFFLAWINFGCKWLFYHSIIP